MAETERRKLAAIMITDIVGYSALTQQNEAHTLELLEEHRRLLRPVFSQYGGQEIKTMADGFLVEFGSAIEAVRCAIAIQQISHECNTSAPPERRIQVRIGVHVGDVVHRENDILGDGVNIASRIEPLAPPGGICVSGQVFDHIRNSLAMPIVRLGRPQLKNIKAPVEIYTILLPWQSRRLPFTYRYRFTLQRKSTRSFVVALIAALVWAGSNLRQHATESKRGATNGKEQRIMVWPFDNISRDEDGEAYADGVTEELRAKVYNIGGLRLIGDKARVRDTRTGKGAVDTCIELGVGTVLKGSVRRAGRSVRITAQLIDVRSQENLWSEVYDRDRKGALDIPSDTAKQIAKALLVPLGVEERQRIEKKPTDNPEAYDLYGRGRYHWNKRTKDEFEKGIDYFNRAIEKDPNYARAYSGLADSYTLLARGGFVSPDEGYQKAKTAVKTALKLDEGLAEAHTSLAFIKMEYDWDWSGAEREFKRAIELNPSLPNAHHWYSHYWTAMGRVDESLVESKRALKFAPHDPALMAHLAWHYLWSRQYDPAIAQAQKTLELDPNNILAHGVLPWAYAHKGMVDEALAEAWRAKSISKHSAADDANLGCVYGLLGRKAEAQKVLADLIKLRQSNKRYVSPDDIAAIYAGLRETDQAFGWLHKAYEEHAGLAYLRVDPRMDGLRSDPRFAMLLAQVGL